MSRFAPFLTCLVASAAIVITATPRVMHAAEKLSLAAVSQIETLVAEKNNRTPAQKKMDSQLVYFAKQRQNDIILNSLPNLETGVHEDENNRVLLDIKATVSPALLNFITQSGGEIVSQVPAFNAIRASLPANQIETLAARADVRFVEPAVESTTNLGSVLSEADRTHRTVTARTSFGVDGTGMKIGVMSDGVNSLAASKANGNLNAKARALAGLSGFGDEGTAMMELIQDMLPGAELIFATCATGNAAFASNILALQAAGCTVIVDDFTYFNESPFQDATISQAVNTVSAAGVMYFSSARNSGNKNDGTSSTWEGDFADGGAASSPITTTGNLLDFGGGVTYNTVGSGGSQRRVDLFWSDPLAGSANDYDLFVLNSTGTTVLRSSTNIQSGTQDPYEATSTLNIGERIVIVKKPSAADRFIHLDIGRGYLAISTAGCVRGHNAAVSANAFSVAATPVSRSPSPNFFVGGVTNPIETFSSDGPRRMFYQPNGTPYTPGDFSSAGGTVFDKPDITAADGSATSVTGFTTFFGTSAAAPHAAAIAAMLKCYNPSLTPAQVRTLMATTALDIEAAGFDRDSGSGIAMGLQAMQAAPVPDVMTIVQTGLNATGAAGGPFIPASGTYTLTNSSGSTLNWTATGTQTWNTVSPPSGTLAPGNSVVVTCALNAAANALPLGNYSDTITITNTTSGFVRQFTANVYVQPFLVSTLWNSYTGGTFSFVSPPHVFMGQAFTLDAAAGTSNIPITKGIAYFISTATATYTNIRINMTFWGAASGAVSGSTDAFSNNLGSYSFDTGPRTITSGVTYPAAFTLPTPIILPGQTGGITFNFQIDSGSGLANTETLYSPVRFGAAIAAGTPAAGTSPTYGYYQNASGETNGNFLGSSFRSFAGNNLALTFQLQSGGGPTMGIKCVGVDVPNGANLPLANNGTFFGTTNITGSTLVRTFTIENSGNAALNLTGSPAVNITGTHSADFTVTAQPSSSVAATNGTTTFQITFNPSAAGTRSATVTIANNDSVNSSYTFAISGTGSTLGPVITSALSASGTGGSPFNYQITATNNPTSYGATGLPVGLSIDTNTGLISGTPQTAGSFNVGISATNADGTATANLLLTLTAPAPVMLFDSYTGAVVTGSPYTARSFMGVPITLGSAGGGSNINIAAGKFYMRSFTAATYSNIRLNLYFWGTATGSIASTPMAFSNLVSSCSIDLGPLTTTANSNYSFVVTLPTPVTMPSAACGIAVNWQGDTGSGLVSNDNLFNVLRHSSDLTVGSFMVGAAGLNGWYQNVIADPLGNFMGGSWRTFTFQPSTQGLAMQLYGSQATPLAQTGAATGVGPLTATLNALVNPAGAVTTATFQYGATTSYGSTSAITLNPNDGTSAQSVAADITGLTPNTTYHYRVSATNSSGTTNGSDLTFTTAASTSVVNVSSTTANGSYKAGTSIPVTVTFSEPVTVTGTPQLQLNSGASVFANYASGSGSPTLTFNYIAGAGDASSDLDYTSTTALTTNGGTIISAIGTVILTLPSPGSPGSLGANKALVIDTAAPTVAVTPTGTTAGNPPITFTLTFSEPVTGLTASSIIVTNATKGALSGSGTTYTLAVTATALGIVTCQVPAGAAVDLALHDNIISNLASVTYTNGPTVTVTPTGITTKTTPITFTLTFSQSVTGLTAAGITVINGTKGALTGSGAVYFLSVIQNTQGAVTCQVSADAARNAALTGNVPSNIASVLYDSVGPTVSVTSAVTLTNTSPIIFTMIFSESVTGLSSSNIAVTNGTKGALTGSGTTYTLSVTPTTQGQITCRVNAVAAVDAAQNGNQVSNLATVTYDSLNPTTTVSTPGLGVSKDALIMFTVTFSEPVTGLAASSITVTNGTKGTLSGSGTVYTLPVTATVDGSVTCRVSGGAAKDAAGNVSAFSNTHSVAYDTIAPTVSVTPSGVATGTSPILFTLTFSEAVYGLLAGEISVINGTQGALVRKDGENYTMQVTPTSDGPVTMQVNAGAAQDAATNDSLASNTASVTYDSVPPTLTSIHLASSNANDSMATVGDVLTLSFTSNEAMQMPVVTLAGQLATVANTAGNNWTARATIAADAAEGDVAFNVAFSDLVDNAAAATTTSDASAVTIDRSPPTLASAQIASSNAVSTRAKTSDVITLTFTTSEPIRTPAVTLAGQSATVTNASGNTWTATTTVSAGTAQGAATISVALTDIVGNVATPAMATSDGSTVTVDRTPPMLTSVHISSNNTVSTLAKLGDTLTLTFTANEAIQPPVVTLAGLTATVNNTSGNSWTATATIAGNTVEGGVTMSVAFIDAVGNVATAVTTTNDASTVMVDRTPPTLTSVRITSNNAKPRFAKAGDSLILTLTANEAIQTPAVTLAGQTATLQNVTGNNWTATRLLTAGVPQGTAAVSVAFLDQAGNAGVNVTATTDASTVGVETQAPGFITHPIARIINPGALVSFTVVADSLSPVTYQWRKDLMEIDDATDATFTLNAAEGDEGSYDCVISNLVDSAISHAVTLTVNDPIVFTADPIDKTVNQGESVELTVTVTGTDPITYQWRRNGDTIPDSDAATLVIPNSTLGDAGHYGVVASNIVGAKTSATGFLSVLSGAPRITRQPASRTVEPDAPVTFSVIAVGTAPFSYEWRKNGKKIADTDSASFAIPSVSAADAAGYTVKITNTAGSVTSDAATLSVKPAAYVFSTLAGSPGESGLANGTADARFFRPSHIVRDSAGNLFVTDRSNFIIRKITPGGTVTTFAGTAGTSGTTNGTGAGAKFTLLEGIGIDSADNLYVADSTAGTIRRITPAAEVTTFAGHFVSPPTSTDGVGTAAAFNEPRGIAVGPGDVVYVSEGGGQTIRKILPNGTVSTLAGLAGLNGAADGMNATARFNRPAGLAVDSAGNLYVADESNHAIRKITPEGEVTTIAGLMGTSGKTDAKGLAARFLWPTGVAVDDSGVLFVTDTGNHTMRSVSSSGMVATLGGLAETAGAADGTGSVARFRSSRGITLDPEGQLYIADTDNHTIRKGTLVPLPELTSQPRSLLVGIGQTANFTVEAEDSPPLTYQWLKKAIKIPATENTATTPSYTTPATTVASAGTYSVIVSGPAGSVISAGARLGVVDIADSDVRVNESANLVLTATAAGESLTYEWRRDDLPLADGDRISGVTTSKLSIKQTELDDASDYTCIVRMGDLGLSTGVFRVGIRVKPVLAEFTPAPWIASGTVTDAITAVDLSSLNRPTFYTVTGLPAGMTFNKTNGHFGGKPNVPGTYTLKITATNAAGTSEAQTIIIEVAALPAASIGTFNGLVDRDTTLSAPVTTPTGLTLQGHGGCLYNLITTHSGTFTGSLKLEDKLYTFPAGSRLEAIPGADPTATVILVRGTAADTIADLTFTFAIDKVTGRLTGAITDGLPASTPIPVDAWRNSWKTTGTTQSPPHSAAALAGNYTAVLDLDPNFRNDFSHPDIPQGRGYLTLTVTPAGVATWGGKLADGTAITGSTTLGPDGQIPLHLILYTPAAPTTAGSVHGWAQARVDSAPLSLNSGHPLLDGELDWIKLAQLSTNATRSYRFGFPLHTLTVIGGLYAAPPPGTPILGLTDFGIGTHNAQLSFSEASLISSDLARPGSPAGSRAGTLNQLLRITATNSIVMPAGAANNPGGVTLSLTPATIPIRQGRGDKVDSAAPAKGLISGKFILKDSFPGYPLAIRSVSWTGILVPRLGIGAGHFLLPQLPTPATSDILSGQVILQRPVPRQ